MENNNDLYKTEQDFERVILVGVDDNKSLSKIEDELNELDELSNTASLEVVGKMTQKLDNPNPSSYIGKGKIDELKDLISLNNADCIICNHELTSSQMNNLSERLNIKVIDRTMLILDIFNSRAKSAEGKLQVELAQLQYNLSHLKGLGKSMSRLGGGASGGIGARRGLGEKKLELDRRYIRERIADLNNEIKIIQTQRKVSREQRERKNIPVISMVGYTNAGKSTIMNLLSDANVLAEDKLFATLDTTTRKVKLLGGSDILFTDTVGFIQKIPHNLIEAFKATLEELYYADILVHVVDSSSDMREIQMTVVYETLKDLGYINKPIITVFNKTDKDIILPFPHDDIAIKTINMSATTGKGREILLQTIEDVLKLSRQQIQVLIPYNETSLVNKIYGTCEIIQKDYKDEGIYIDMYSNTEITNRLDNYIIK